ncbi:hypothetical protein CDD81_5887 [Ophiocordyceps australis]|uniref:FAR1 domain-containing protein n=1 Tax=Ophiocordyceps australis TaxID=1399860 RepID=A0A2C5YB77_9HYPO|nr:hypothetical protein CDD81_5887 [Ophiocordyceps australis]
MFGILEAVSVPQSGIFASCEDLMRDLNSRAEKEGYKIVKARSHRSRPGAPIIRADLVCERGGRPYRCQATKHKSSTKKTNCPWKAKAVDRKTVGGWVLTVICDHHNHEPGTPEPPTPSEASEAGDNDADDVPEGPRPDPETSAVLQVAGVSDAVLRLSGDTFHRFKNDYRKMSQPERLGILAQMQLRIAAIYAVQNEDLQRQKRQDAQQRRHREIEESRRRLEAQGVRYVNQHRQRHTARISNPDASVDAVNAAPPTPEAPQREYPRLAPAPSMHETPFDPASPDPAQTSGAENLYSFQIFPGPPKRLRGGRPLQLSPQAAQQMQQTVMQTTEQSTQV